MSANEQPPDPTMAVIWGQHQANQRGQRNLRPSGMEISIFPGGRAGSTHTLGTTSGWSAHGRYCCQRILRVRASRFRPGGFYFLRGSSAGLTNSMPPGPVN
jgi:hypothetical protein